MKSSTNRLPQVEEASTQWLSYICGARHLIVLAKLQSSFPGVELQAILDWLYYHDVLGRFSLKQWRNGRGLPKDNPATYASLGSPGTPRICAKSRVRRLTVSMRNQLTRITADTRLSREFVPSPPTSLRCHRNRTRTDRPTRL